ncbi:unnamed protein product [Sphagnum balticum]
MITTPRGKGSREPCCNATKVVEFFEQDAVKIFPETFTDEGGLGRLWEACKSVLGPVYSPDYLKALLEKKFGQALLSDALTSVIIPAFDTENEVPVFFSNLTGVDSTEPLYNVQVKDACRATTAVPIFFPAANFKENQNQSGRPIKEFYVIDGGIAVNDPTLVAVTQEIVEKRRAIAKEQSLEIDFRNVLVLSLGTGQHPMRFVAKAHWSSLEWLINPAGLPLVSSFFSASGDMVEYYTSMMFDAHQCGHHYLRIQTDCLPTSEFWGIDDATEQNFETLKVIARNLLKSPVSKRNFATGKLDAITGGGSNKQALRRFAGWLVEERRKSNGEGSSSVKLPGEFGQTRTRSPLGEKPESDETLRNGTAPSTAEAVQTAVDGCLAVQAVDGCSAVQVAVDGVIVSASGSSVIPSQVWSVAHHRKRKMELLN